MYLTIRGALDIGDRAMAIDPFDADAISVAQDAMELKGLTVQGIEKVIGRYQVGPNKNLLALLNKCVGRARLIACARVCCLSPERWQVRQRVAECMAAGFADVRHPAFIKRLSSRVHLKPKSHCVVELFTSGRSRARATYRYLPLTDSDKMSLGIELEELTQKLEAAYG